MVECLPGFDTYQKKGEGRGGVGKRERRKRGKEGEREGGKRRRMGY